MSISFTRNAVTMAAALALINAGAGRAGAADEPSVTELRQQVQALQERLNDLEKKQSGDWMTVERQDQIRAIVQDVVANARLQTPSEGPTFGYKNGFFIQSGDNNFKLSIGGFIQARYTFASHESDNAAQYATAPREGDINGFDFRRARLIFSGHAFTPNLTYCISYDFAGDASGRTAVTSVTSNGSGGLTSKTIVIPTDKNYGQIVDMLVAYRFTDALNVRVGAFLTPFTRAEYLVAGSGFADLPNVVWPFDPARSLGASVFGQPVKDRFSYELNINNGQCSTALGRAGEVGSGATDNRIAAYLRLQYAGAGKLSDFSDEPDMRKDNSTLAWMVGGAVGYESANTTSTAFPSPQGAITTIPVGAESTAGFVAYPLNGDLFRATIDGAAKYQGWSFNAAGYFQQINENPAVAGSTAPTLPAGYGTAAGKSSFYQLGYYGQASYMLTPKLELVARAGQFITEGSTSRMEEYAVGVNYYIFGHNFKIQTDMTYIPNAAYTSSVMGSGVNTEDLIFRAQLQLKF